MTDEELLALVGAERTRSVGFDNDAELRTAREMALNYSKGEMPDFPALPNRSSAVSTDVNDAIETVLPDLMEIFTGGDDVVSFVPQGQEDVEAAQQETDYLRNVIFAQNGGFLTLYSFFKDALQVRTGVVKWWWDEKEPEPETLEGKSIEEAVVIAQQSEILEAKEGDEPDTVDLTIAPKITGKVCIKAVPPEDFTVAEDTVRLSDATYCAARFRPRAQELLAQGISREIVDQLPAYGTPRDDTIDQARDVAGEHDQATAADGTHDLRQVETVEHYIRVADDGGRLQLWRVLTGAGESVLIEKEKVDRIQYAGLTPYLVTHRFYGRSVADLLLEIQRINTALTRNFLDSVYFANNQRMEVAEDKAGNFTMADLLRNEPGYPIRVKQSGAVNPVVNGGAGFNGPDALEYFKTVAEQRTGIVRNAQGLKPDTLHDTAKGAMVLISAAQKRTRLIARIFAETGVKDLFLGVHALLRSHGEQQQMVRLRGKWVPIDPSSWGSRDDMVIEVGVGSGGKEAELQQILAEMNVVKELIGLQGGEGPIVTWKNLYELVKRFFEKGGCKAPEAYLTDPDAFKAQQQANGGPPQKPDPAMAKLQAQVQADQAKAQNDFVLEKQKAEARLQLEREAAQHDLALQAQRNDLEMDLMRQKHAQDFQLKQQQAEAEAQLKRDEMAMEFQLRREQQAINPPAPATVQGAEFGGQPG